MSKIIDLTGDRFGSWIVLSRSETRYRQTQWLCRCECGIEMPVSGINLRTGASTNCGCRRERLTKHGFASRLPDQEPTYRAWKAMRNRVLNPNGSSWANYGERGITLDPRWNDFEAFLADMGKRPAGTTIDRVDNSKGYGPDNCRWASKAIQSRNTRRNRWVILDGDHLVLKDAATRLGVTDTAVYQRMARKNIDPQEAIDQLAARRR